jgi:hypothetical protein
MKTNSRGYVKQSVETASNQLTVDSAKGYLIAANRVDNSIQLFDEGGNNLLSTVGGEGRGPAEFKNISQLHVGTDHALYALDIILKRITKFKIESRVLHYITSFTVKPEHNISLRDVFITKDGNYGVFHRIDDYETREESFHLYKLDDKFIPVKQLIELPGNEKLKLDENFYGDHYTGRNTYWALDGQWFFYISSQSPVVHKYNLRTGKLTTEQYFSLKERANTQKRTKVLKDRFDALIKRFPSVAEAIEESESLPMFDNFLSSNNQLLFDVFYAGGDGGRVIFVDLETGDVTYIKTASEFWRFALGDKMLYGIETRDDGPKIKMLNLN